MCFEVRKNRPPFFHVNPFYQVLACLMIDMAFKEKNDSLHHIRVSAPVILTIHNSE